MQNTKLFQLFKTFTKVEQNRLQRFVESPYHNQHRDVQGLLQYLLHTSAPTLEGAYRHLYPAQPYNGTKLRNTQSYLLKVMEKFLVYESLEQNQETYYQLLLPLYRQRSLPKGFQSIFRNSRRLLERQAERSVNYHYQDFFLQQEQFLHAEDRNRLEDKNIQEVLDSFDVYYSINKLRYCITALSHQNVFNVQYNLGMVKDILTQIEVRDWLQHPTVAAYYHSYKILSETHTEENYPALKYLIVKEWKCFEQGELRGLYLIGINSLIKRLNEGQEEVLSELFFLYQSGLERALFLVDGELSRFTYKNIASVAIKCAAYDWVANFVDHYADYVNKDHRCSYQKYCQAKLYYSVQDYQRAMYCLQTLGSTDREVIMDGKGMLVKIYYDLGEYGALESLLSSFKTYLKRDRYISAYLKENYLKFVRYVQRLQQHNPYDRKARQQLVASIEQEPKLPERKWLLGQLNA